MAKTTYELWQLKRQKVAEAKREEAKAIAAVHSGFKKASCPTSDEIIALRRAIAKTIRFQNRLLEFVNKVK